MSEKKKITVFSWKEAWSINPNDLPKANLPEGFSCGGVGEPYVADCNSGKEKEKEKSSKK